MANQKILRYGTASTWMIVMDGDRGIAPGGFNRQILTKLSGTDYDAQWRDPVGFTFTQGTAPTIGLDGTSALATGVTWYDTTTGNAYVRVAAAWVQFTWGDSEARYVNTTGDTINGQLTLNGGGGDTLELRPGAADHVYIEFFARTSNPGSRSAYLGFPAAASTAFTIANSLPGDIVLAPSTGRVALNADPTSALHAATKQYADLKVAKTGDTMTGTLNMATATKLVFNDELGTRIQLYTGYSLGIEGGTLRYISNGVHAFTGAITTNGNVTSAASVVTTRPGGLWLNGASDSNHRVVSVNNLSGMPWSDGPVLCGANGWAFLSAATGTYLMGFRGTTDNSRRYLWVSDGMLIGTAPDDASNTHTLRVVGSMYANSSITTPGTNQGNITIGTQPNYSTQWPDCGLRSGSNGTFAGLAIWVNGIAPQFRVGTGAQEVYLRAAGGEHIITMNSSAFSTASSRKYKQDIVDWPMDKAMALSAGVNEEVEDPISIIRKVRPVFYRRNREQWLSQLPLDSRRALALSRLHNFKDSRGEARYHSDELIHDCGRDPCRGTADDPCTRVKDWESGSIGFIAEELLEVVPQLVTYDHETGERNGVDLMQIASLAVAACKSQQEIIDALVERVEALEVK